MRLACPVACAAKGVRCLATAKKACVGSWVMEGVCTRRCGGGRQLYVWTETSPAYNGGKACAFKPQAKKFVAGCNGTPCRRNCAGKWRDIGSCSSKCGGGAQVSVYLVTAAAQSGGQRCPATNGQVKNRACNVQKCVGKTPVDCKGAFKAVGACSKTCRGGLQDHVFLVSAKAELGGKACAQKEGFSKTTPCNAAVACAKTKVDCVGAWGRYGQCSRTCGTGAATSTYKELVSPTGGGSACAIKDGAQKSKACTAGACPVACKGRWTTIGLCSRSCTGGRVDTVFLVTTAAAKGGLACAAANGATRTKACNQGVQCAAPKRDCVGDWTHWGACSQSCGGGTQSATFRISKTKLGAGNGCTERDARGAYKVATDGDKRARPCRFKLCPDTVRVVTQSPLAASVSDDGAEFTLHVPTLVGGAVVALLVSCILLAVRSKFRSKAVGDYGDMAFAPQQDSAYPIDTSVNLDFTPAEQPAVDIDGTGPPVAGAVRKLSAAPGVESIDLETNQRMAGADMIDNTKSMRNMV